MNGKQCNTLRGKAGSADGVAIYLPTKHSSAPSQGGVLLVIAKAKLELGITSGRISPVTPSFV